jgi:cytochrome c oxidase cbb3-type subunit 3
MSDFTSGFWSLFVAGATLVSVAACALLLMSMSRKRVAADPDKTGHVWDEDLDEYNNPLPRWWVWLFWITIVFSLAYLWLYPGLGTFQGSKKWTSAGEYAEEVRLAEEQVAPLYARFAKADLRQMSADPEARAVGQRLFLNHCAQCHASDARGAKGFPNLTDDAWLYGGEVELIEKTILDGRNGTMPAWGPVLGPEGVKDMANHVRSLAGLEHDAARATRGKEKFAMCVGCHGAEGKGNKVVGAPDLTDRIWEYGSSEKAISETIANGRRSVMPAHRELLGEQRVRLLAAYVYGLSHPETVRGDLINVTAKRPK